MLNCSIINNMIPFRIFRLGYIICLVIFLIIHAAPAIAHRVTLFAWIEGDTVHTESKFGSGRKAVGAPVEVYDAHGNKLLEGKTDDEGEFSFKLPKKTALKIVLQAGSGHRAEWKLSAEEIEEALGGQAVEKTENPADTEQHSLQPAETEEAGNIPQGTITLEAAELQKIIEASLDKKLAPIKKDLAGACNKGPDIRDILGGIGYIMGLVGIALYMANRRKKE